jgi:hypothetical protein
MLLIGVTLIASAVSLAYCNSRKAPPTDASGSREAA